MKFACLSGLACAVLLLPSLALAKGPAYSDPKAAAKEDKDFAIQGEYVGVIDTGEEEVKMGVQVIALGEGKFRAVSYTGGLPGAGWDGKERVTTDGARDGDAVKFENEHAVGVIRKGVLVVEVKESPIRAELKRVERKSPTLGKKAPENAVVLFNGKTAEHFENGKKDEAGHLIQGVTSKRKFGDHSIHIEFRLPYQPNARGQARGNSGIYVQGRYEVQMLDSFGLEGKHNECGGIYEIRDPNVNMCLPPLTWQTYDIDFKAAQFDDAGKMTAKPQITVRHNGVVIHDKVELPKATRASRLKPGPEDGPIYLQNHGNPVRYRNIWVVEK